MTQGLPSSLSIPARTSRAGAPRWTVLGPGLGFWQVKSAAREIHELPPQGHDLREPAAGEDQQPQGVDRRPALDAFLLALAQDLAETAQLGGAQIALALLLLVLLDMAAGIGAVRAQPPDLGQVEGLGQKLQAAVGLDRGETEIVVEAGDVGPRDLGDLEGGRCED